MKRRHLLRLGAAGPVCLALPGLATAASTKIVLGQSAAFSGPASALGERFKEGAQLAFDRVNARGGIHGRTLELRSMDDGYEPDRCAENTQKLLKDDVFALFGYVGTPTSMADGRTGFSSGPRKLKIVRCPRSAHSFRAGAMCLNAG